MSYGSVMFTEDEIAYVKVRFEAVRTQVLTSIESSSSSDERQFYERAAVTLSKWNARLQLLHAGANAFSEDELRYLKGTLAGRGLELAPHYVAARKACSNDLGEIAREYEVWANLCEKLERPFLSDTSQDPEPDEE